MNTARLKNIVIIILLLANAFLLVLLFSRRAEEREMHGHTLEQLSQLYAANGVSLDGALVADFSAALSEVQPARDPAAEQSFASALLGSVTSVDSGGGIYRYYCIDGLNRGSCLFRGSGSLEASLSRAVDDPTQFCADLCAPYGYLVQETLTDGARTVITATRSVGGASVYNCALTFTFSAATLTAVTGSFLAPIDTAESDTLTLDAVTALVNFLDYRSASGAVCTDVTALSGGYLLQSSASETMQLVPVVRIETDVSNYYVNVQTGEVTRA